MIYLLIAAHLLNCILLHATEQPSHKSSPLRSSQKSTNPRSLPYVGTQLRHSKTLEIYLHNTETVAKLPAITKNGAKPRLNAIVHVTRPKQ
jgi:hypothetical protein